MLSFDVSETAFLQQSWLLEKCQHFKPPRWFQEKRQNNRAKPTRKPCSNLQVLCSLAEPSEKNSNAPLPRISVTQNLFPVLSKIMQNINNNHEDCIASALIRPRQFKVQIPD